MCTNVEDSSTHEQTTVDSLSLEEEYWDEGGWDVGYSEVVAVLGTAEAWSEPLATDGEREREQRSHSLSQTNMWPLGLDLRKILSPFTAAIIADNETGTQCACVCVCVCVRY